MDDKERDILRYIYASEEKLKSYSKEIESYQLRTEKALEKLESLIKEGKKIVEKKIEDIETKVSKNGKVFLETKGVYELKFNRIIIGMALLSAVVIGKGGIYLVELIKNMHTVP